MSQRRSSGKEKLKFTICISIQVLPGTTVGGRADRPNGRVVPRDVFIRSYVDSINNVELVLKEFPQITVYFAENDYNDRLKKLHIGIKSLQESLPEVYTAKELESIIN